MKAAILSLALFATPLSAARQPFEFQGVALDAKYSDISNMFKEGQCKEGSGETVCVIGNATVIDFPSTVEYHFENVTAEKKLYKIQVYLLSDSAASKALGGLTQKWGSPEPDYRRYIWRRGAYRITLLQVVGGSAITYLNRDMQDAFDKKVAASAAAGL